MATEVSDLNIIQDEDALRKMWTQTEDFARKKEIRLRMYRLREERLKSYYVTKETSSDSITEQKHSASSHVDSVKGQGFMAMKAKEIRDSSSPVLGIRNLREIGWTNQDGANQAVQCSTYRQPENVTVEYQISNPEEYSTSSSYTTNSKWQKSSTSDGSEVVTHEKTSSNAAVSKQEFVNGVQTENIHQQASHGTSTVDRQQLSADKERVITQSSNKVMPITYITTQNDDTDRVRSLNTKVTENKQPNQSKYDYKFDVSNDSNTNVTKINSTKETKNETSVTAKDTIKSSTTQNISKDYSSKISSEQIRSVNDQNNAVSSENNVLQRYDSKDTRSDYTTKITNDNIKSSSINKNVSEQNADFSSTITNDCHTSRDSTQYQNAANREDTTKNITKQDTKKYDTKSYDYVISTDTTKCREDSTKNITKQDTKKYDTKSDYVSSTDTTSKYASDNKSKTVNITKQDTKLNDYVTSTDTTTKYVSDNTSKTTTDTPTDQNIIKELRKLDSYLSTQAVAGSAPSTPTPDICATPITTQTRPSVEPQHTKYADKPKPATTSDKPQPTDYTTTYQQAFSKTLDVSATHNAFASSLRASPDRSTPPPGRRSSSKSSLDRNSPGKSPAFRTDKTPSPEKQPSYTVNDLSKKYTASFQNRVRNTSKSPSPGTRDQKRPTYYDSDDSTATYKKSTTNLTDVTEHDHRITNKKKVIQTCDLTDQQEFVVTSKEVKPTYTRTSPEYHSERSVEREFNKKLSCTPESSPERAFKPVRSSHVDTSVSIEKLHNKDTRRQSVPVVPKFTQKTPLNVENRYTDNVKVNKNTSFQRKPSTDRKIVQNGVTNKNTKQLPKNDDISNKYITKTTIDIKEYSPTTKALPKKLSNSTIAQKTKQSTCDIDFTITKTDQVKKPSSQRPAQNNLPNRKTVDSSRKEVTKTNNGYITSKPKNQNEIVRKDSTSIITRTNHYDQTKQKKSDQQVKIDNRTIERPKKRTAPKQSVVKTKGEDIKYDRKYKTDTVVIDNTVHVSSCTADKTKDTKLKNIKKVETASSSETEDELIENTTLDNIIITENDTKDTCIDSFRVNKKDSSNKQSISEDFITQEKVIQEGVIDGSIPKVEDVLGKDVIQNINESFIINEGILITDTEKDVKNAYYNPNIKTSVTDHKQGTTGKQNIRTEATLTKEVDKSQSDSLIGQNKATNKEDKTKYDKTTKCVSRPSDFIEREREETVKNIYSTKSAIKTPNKDKHDVIKPNTEPSYARDKQNMYKSEKTKHTTDIKNQEHKKPVSKTTDSDFIKHEREETSKKSTKQVVKKETTKVQKTESNKKSVKPETDTETYKTSITVSIPKVVVPRTTAETTKKTDRKITVTDKQRKITTSQTDSKCSTTSQEVYENLEDVKMPSEFNSDNESEVSHKATVVKHKYNKPISSKTERIKTTKPSAGHSSSSSSSTISLVEDEYTLDETEFHKQERTTDDNEQNTLNVVVRMPSSSRETTPKYRDERFCSVVDDTGYSPRYADAISEPDDVQSDKAAFRKVHLEKVVKVDEEDDIENISVADRVNKFLETTKEDSRKQTFVEQDVFQNRDQAVSKTKQIFETIAKQDTATTKSKAKPEPGHDGVHKTVSRKLTQKDYEEYVRNQQAEQDRKTSKNCEDYVQYENICENSVIQKSKKTIDHDDTDKQVKDKTEKKTSTTAAKTDTVNTDTEFVYVDYNRGNATKDIQKPLKPSARSLDVDDYINTDTEYVDTGKINVPPTVTHLPQQTESKTKSTVKQTDVQKKDINQYGHKQKSTDAKTNKSKGSIVNEKKEKFEPETTKVNPIKMVTTEKPSKKIYEHTAITEIKSYDEIPLQRSTNQYSNEDILKTVSKDLRNSSDRDSTVRVFTDQSNEKISVQEDSEFHRFSEETRLQRPVVERKIEKPLSVNENFIDQEKRFQTTETCKLSDIKAFPSETRTRTQKSPSPIKQTPKKSSTPSTDNYATQWQKSPSPSKDTVKPQVVPQRRKSPSPSKSQTVTQRQTSPSPSKDVKPQAVFQRRKSPSPSKSPMITQRPTSPSPSKDVKPQAVTQRRKSPSPSKSSTQRQKSPSPAMETPKSYSQMTKLSDICEKQYKADTIKKQKSPSPVRSTKASKTSTTFEVNQREFKKQKSPSPLKDTVNTYQKSSKHTDTYEANRRQKSPSPLTTTAKLRSKFQKTNTDTDIKKKVLERRLSTTGKNYENKKEFFESRTKSENKILDTRVHGAYQKQTTQKSDYKPTSDRRTPDRKTPDRKLSDTKQSVQVPDRREKTPESKTKRKTPDRNKSDRKTPDRSTSRQATPEKKVQTSVNRQTKTELIKSSSSPFGVTLRKTKSPASGFKVVHKITTEEVKEKKIEDIFELDLLETMLQQATEYDIRSRIRTQIRLVKRQQELKQTTPRTTPEKSPARDIRKTHTEVKSTKQESRLSNYTPEVKENVKRRLFSDDDQKISAKNRQISQSASIETTDNKTTQRTTKTETESRTFHSTTHFESSSSLASDSKSTTESIISGYGVGPTDEHGKPLFGLKALRMSNETRNSAEDYSNTKRTEKSEITDHSGKPLFGLKALQRVIDENDGKNGKSSFSSQSSSTMYSSRTAMKSDSTGKMSVVKDEVKGELHAKNGEQPTGTMTRTKYSYQKPEVGDAVIKSTTATQRLGQDEPLITEYDDRYSSIEQRRKSSTSDEESWRSKLKSSSLIRKISSENFENAQRKFENGCQLKGSSNESQEGRRVLNSSSSEEFTKHYGSQRDTEEGQYKSKANRVFNVASTEYENKSQSVSRSSSFKEIKSKFQQATVSSSMKQVHRSKDGRESPFKPKIETADKEKSKDFKTGNVNYYTSSVVTESKASDRSFLEDTSKVSSTQDIINRMKSSNHGTRSEYTDEDKEAVSMLNKFIGASIILHGMEQGSRSHGSVTTSRVSSSVQQTESRKSQIKGEEEIDLDNIWDEVQLRELLEACSDYEGRRLIRARLRAVMAEHKACADVITSVEDQTQQQTNESSETSSVTTSTNENYSSQTEVHSRTSSRFVKANSIASSPFAKFRQLERQNSLPSSGAPIYKFTDPKVARSASSIKDRLLSWVKAQTKEYENIQIDNFSTSWNNGLAFCALIHHFCPNAFDYNTLTPEKRRYNFELAFRVAEEEAGIVPLLDVEDMVVMKRPDWKCVFTYVQSVYRRFHATPEAVRL